MSTPRTLWLALDFPALPLEVFVPAAPQRPMAVRDGEYTGPCNPDARRLGVRPGQGLTEARARAPALLLIPRDRDLERETLAGLALWAREFTSQVSLYGDHTLFLELAGSLRLFGDISELIARITEGCRVLGHDCRHALAPTAAAAGLLARARHPLPVLDPARLPAALAPVPVALTEHGPALTNLGLERLGQCLQLPRAALGRRFGAEFVLWLDRLLGRRPWPLPLWQPPASFHRRLSLPAETASSEALGFAFHRLLQELGAFLRVRVMGVEVLSAQMFHRKHPVTQVTLSLLAAEQNPRILMELLQQRLQRLTLPAPVHEIRLGTELLAPLAPQSASLFGDPAPRDLHRLLDRLRARLGREAVHGLALGEDYRPEYHQRLVPMSAAGGGGPGPPPATIRPLWLLPGPHPLPSDGENPLYNGQLELISEAERIESGWWEAPRAAARDYYRARTPRGEQLWIFRDRYSGRWYLHGLFA